MHLFAQPALGTNAHAVADDQHPDHQLRIDRRARRSGCKTASAIGEGHRGRDAGQCPGADGRQGRVRRGRNHRTAAQAFLECPSSPSLPQKSGDLINHGTPLPATKQPLFQRYLRTPAVAAHRRMIKNPAPRHSWLQIDLSPHERSAIGEPEVNGASHPLSRSTDRGGAGRDADRHRVPSASACNPKTCTSVLWDGARERRRSSLAREALIRCAALWLQ